MEHTQIGELTLSPHPDKSRLVIEIDGEQCSTTLTVSGATMLIARMQAWMAETAAEDIRHGRLC
jgi:hypothetical protein